MRRIILFLCLCLLFSMEFTPLPSGALYPQEPAEKLPQKKLTLPLKDADVRTVLQTIAEDTGINFAISSDVEGKVTLNVTDILLEDILKTITLLNECDYLYENNIVIITKKGKVRTISRLFRLEHVDATSVKETITPLLSADGEMLTFIRSKGVGNEKNENRSNTLIVTDTPAKVEQIAQMIKELDTPAPQVLIEAQMIEVNVNTLNALGINWNVQVSMSGPSFQSTFPIPRTDFSGRFILPGEPATAGGPETTRLTAKTTDIKAGKLSYDQFTALAKLIQTKGPDVNILAQPRVATMDNQEAEIVIGDIIPIPKYSYNEQRGQWEITGYTDQKVGITLTTTPHITNNNQIIMTIKPEISEIVGWVVGPSGQNEKPQISTRRADTQVRVHDNETIIIGGLIKTVETVNESKVPLLGDIPILGGIFRSKSVEKEKVDLLIFITPHILTDERIKELTSQEKTRMENSSESREGKQQANPVREKDKTQDKEPSKTK